VNEGGLNFGEARPAQTEGKGKKDNEGKGAGGKSGRGRRSRFSGGDSKPPEALHPRDPIEEDTRKGEIGK